MELRISPRTIVPLAALSLGLSVSAARAQAHHEYAQPNPQRYQHAPIAPQKLPSFAPAPDQQSADPAAPRTQQPPATPSEDSVASTGNELLDFFQQHMALTFICFLLLAPLWAVFGMRKTKHPYDH